MHNTGKFLYKKEYEYINQLSHRSLTILPFFELINNKKLISN